MNAPTRVRLDDITVADVDLTAIMQREGVRRVEQYRNGMFSVELFDHRVGAGHTVAAALDKARQPDAVRVA